VSDRVTTACRRLRLRCVAQTWCILGRSALDVASVAELAQAICFDKPGCRPPNAPSVV